MQPFLFERSRELLLRLLLLAALFLPTATHAAGTLTGPDAAGKYLYQVGTQTYTYTPQSDGKWRITSSSGLDFTRSAKSQEELAAEQERLGQARTPPQDTIQALEGLSAIVSATTPAAPADPAAGGGKTPSPDPAPTDDPKTSTGATVPKISLQNPFEGKISDLRQLLTSTIPNFLLAFIGLVALVLFFISAVRYLFNAGNQEATTEAKNGMLGAIIGLVVALSAFGALAIVKRLVETPQEPAGAPVPLPEQLEESA